VPNRLLHVSDLHFGGRDDPGVESALGDLIERVRPELVVASGDLTNRGLAAQHEQAADFLRRLGPPVLAVPGNHDIPYRFPARFTTPWREFERQWETTEPVLSLPGVHVVGLNSVRPWRHQSGGLGAAQLERAAARLAEAPSGSLRVAVLHHQLVGAPWRNRKKPVADRTQVLARLAGAGAELILGGHIHQGAVSERREFEVVGDDAASVVVSIAPGLGQPRPRRRGEAHGVVVYTASTETLRVDSYRWHSGSWEPNAARTFPRGQSPLEPV
jgi:3',5'-cyclic AMP phosphodiesterase CpdA